MAVPWAACGSALFYALSGDWRNASLMFIVLATAGAGAVIIDGVKGINTTQAMTAPIAEAAYSLTPGVIRAIQALVYTTRYAVAASTTDWSRLND